MQGFSFPHKTLRLLVFEILIEFEVLEGEPKVFCASLYYKGDDGIFYLACESFDLLLAQDGLTKSEKNHLEDYKPLDNFFQLSIR